MPEYTWTDELSPSDTPDLIDVFAAEDRRLIEERERQLQDTFDRRMRDIESIYPDSMGYTESFRVQYIANMYGRSSIPAHLRPAAPIYRICTRCQRQYYAPANQMGQHFRNYPSGNLRPICRECERTYTRQRRLAAAARERMAEHGRRFGIELEVNTGLDSDQLVSALQDAGIEVRNPGYSHAVISQWKIVPDSSVSGWEVVSPPLLWSERDQIRTVCRVLSDLGCTPGRQCGLHVHHEVIDLDTDQMRDLLRTWVRLQPMHDSLTALHRQQGQWSDHFYPDEVERICRQSSPMSMANYAERYKSLNLTCYPDYGTVEVRQHESTLDADKIIAWVAYGQSIIDLSLEGGTSMDQRDVRDADPCYVIDGLPLRDADCRNKLKDTIINGSPELDYDAYDDDYDDGW